MNAVRDMNVKLAEAFGLKIERLQSFTLEVKANGLPTVTAVYVPIGAGGPTIGDIVESVVEIRKTSMSFPT